MCGSDYFYIRCIAHILNLIVQEGLKVASSSIHKIRESIKYVKGSEGRMKTFKDCVAKVGGINTKMGLRLDVVTRWNSTFFMLEIALLHQCAFISLEFEDRGYLNCPTNEEWDRGEKCMNFCIHSIKLVSWYLILLILHPIWISCKCEKLNVC